LTSFTTFVESVERSDALPVVRHEFWLALFGRPGKMGSRLLRMSDVLVKRWSQ